MEPGSWFKKVFVPENRPIDMGTPESSADTAAKTSDLPPVGMPEPPGSSGDIPQGNGEGAPIPQTGDNAENAADASSLPPLPDIQDNHEEYHYAAFDDESESGLWNRHTRIILAMAFVLLSAMIMWWILA